MKGGSKLPLSNQDEADLSWNPAADEDTGAAFNNLGEVNPSPPVSLESHVCRLILPPPQLCLKEPAKTS